MTKARKPEELTASRTERRDFLRTGLALGAVAAAGTGLLRPSVAKATGEESSTVDTPFTPNSLVFNVDMTGSTLDRVSLRNSLFAESNMGASGYYNVVIDSSTLENVTLDGSTLRFCTLRNVTLELCDIEGMTINGINVKDALGL